LADSAGIFIIGGVVGFIVGLVISLKVANANPKTEEEIERKYVGGAGRMQIYFGAPIFIIAVLGKMFFEKLLNRAGTETGVWVAFGVALVIFMTGLILYEHVPPKFVIPIGIIGWMLTLAMILSSAV
jgi:hypothetical protein